MNFFKSILLEDPEPPKEEASHEPSPNSPLKSSQQDRNSSDVDQDGNADLWSFGAFMKTLAARSESVIETYGRDLKEFGSGLRKESEIIREAASRAVKDLPASLEAGTSAAHGVLDGVLKSTTEIISKESQLFASDGESETPEMNRSLNAGRYSWFETQLSGIQSDMNTFCEEPEDVEEYKKWKSRFELEDKKDEIEELIGENGALETVYKRVVPSEVDHETFWCRYFYRVDKLKQQERVRANLVKRAISVDDDDDLLSWDVDDDDEMNGNGIEVTSGAKAKADGAGKKGVIDESLNDGTREEKHGGSFNVFHGDKSNVVESSKKSSGDVSVDEKEVKSDEVSAVKSDEKVKSEETVKENKHSENVGVEKGESSEESDVAVVSDQQAKMEEEDLGWDEIEDIGSGDEKKISTTTHCERPNRPDLKKQLTSSDDDEVLSWGDIEDDDEPVKS